MILNLTGTFKQSLNILIMLQLHGIIVDLEKETDNKNRQNTYILSSVLVFCLYLAILQTCNNPPALTHL